MYSVIFLFLIQYKIINHGIKSMLIKWKNNYYWTTKNNSHINLFCRLFERVRTKYMIFNIRTKFQRNTHQKTHQSSLANLEVIEEKKPKSLFFLPLISSRRGFWRWALRKFAFFSADTFRDTCTNGTTTKRRLRRKNFFLPLYSSVKVALDTMFLRS